ncbi:MAG: hypothetical protein WCP29_10870 [Acidobacteriota bacterium]
MIKRCAVAIVALAWLALPSPSTAQDGPVTLSLGAMAIGPLSGTGRQFSTGLGADLAVTWHLTEQLGLRFDYVQASLGTNDTPQFPASVPTQADARLKFGSASVVFRAPAERVRIYVVGGIGLYHRSVNLSVTSPGPVSVCNPWWFVCLPGPVQAGQVSASRSTTDLGVNLGAGVAMGRFFAEMRYHYVWGPTFSTPAGAVAATGKFLPLIAGIRF